MLKKIAPVLCSLTAFILSAQDQPSPGQTAPAPSAGQTQKPANENGSILFYGDGGWSFDLPAVRAGAIFGSTNIISPERTTLASPSFGINVTAWRFLVPFVDFTLYDTGKATASIGPVTSQASATTWSFNGGLRVVAGKSRVRGYAEFGGGLLHANLTTTSTIGTQTTTGSASNSSSSVMYGGGMQVFVGRKWGSDIGFDGFHVSEPFNALTGTGHNYSRVRIGLFYQTKSAIP